MKTKKRSNQWIAVRFILIIVASGLLGFFASMLVAHLTDSEGIALSGVGEALGPVVPAAFVGCNVLAAAISLILCSSVKKQAAGWDGEDESIDQVEKRLNYPLGLANVMMVLNFLLFSATVEVIEHTAYGGRYEGILFPMCLATFVLGFVWIIWMTNRVVRLEQRLNPEKRGNVLDTSFKKQWLGSCDEAEMLKTYQAGYSGYQAGSTACMVLWVVATFAQLWAGTGIFPVICVCAIWVTMMLGSLISAVRLEKH